jgi:hypothetical protein
MPELEYIVQTSSFSCKVTIDSISGRIVAAECSLQRFLNGTESNLRTWLYKTFGADYKMMQQRRLF